MDNLEPPARRLLPLGLGGQRDLLVRPNELRPPALGQPAGVGQGLVPGDAHDRMVGEREGIPKS